MWSLGHHTELARRLEFGAVALADACAIEPGIEVLVEVTPKGIRMRKREFVASNRIKMRKREA